MSYMVNIIVSLSCALSFPSASLMKEKLFSFSVDSRSDLHHLSRVFSLFKRPRTSTVMSRTWFQTNLIEANKVAPRCRKQSIEIKHRHCTWITLVLYISLPSLPDFNVKMPKFTFCRGREHKTTIFFSFPEL